MTAPVPPLPTVRLKIERRSNHPWIFQKMVEKPAEKPRPGSVVDIVDRAGAWVGRGFYNGHSRIALRVLTERRDEAIDADWFARRIADAVRLRRELLRLDEVADGWRVVHSEGDGISGLVVDRYGDLLVVEFFSAGAFRHREWIYAALRAEFPGCRFYSFAEDHVQKQESFDFRAPEAPEPALITEHGVRFRASPGSGHKTGFFADQRDNREFLTRFTRDARVLDLCCNSGGFAIYAKARGGAAEVTGIDLDEEILAIARKNAQLNDAKVRFVQSDIFPWLREAATRGEAWDVVVLDPAKMTRDREQVIPALKKYLDMNKLALSVVKPGGVFATFSCTGLVSEEQFLDMLRRAAFYAGRTVQVLRVAGAGGDHPFMAHVQESRYLKAVFCRVD
ncbi:class I SAM-dependent rRNA methyltransferase [Coralloluteibacterium stylophorae]|uniref:Class I SAM-dependent rRNA methyltransferase n=1 Tax=Coralloluteibacterium stylophorae TaxID=1776034 RepID=A0A8J7VQU7_9GAMM|nr:class I SAM-dependent rRNA methyltransferase [Coralloluteibacterium stylophorae]MBS7458159.1 class I SAM-dependent rRNA methyltransferase [Coralloluteibacterium stylophorae]